MELQQWIEIDSDEVINASGSFVGSDGQERPWATRKQLAYLGTKGNRYPDQTHISLEKDQAPYPKGKYMIGVALEATKAKIETRKYVKLIPLEK